MASEELSRRLNEDEFAFYFVGGTGVIADGLGDFLIRAATVARQNGAELHVVALQPGSLAVILRVVKKSGVAVGREFKKAPIQTSTTSALFVITVVNALSGAMSPSQGVAKPIAKAGAELVAGGHVDHIEIVTQTTTTIVMDVGSAGQIREGARTGKRGRLMPADQVLRLVEAGRHGNLTGAVVDVHGQLHFRPDGFRYLVPIDMVRSAAASALVSGMHATVTAELLTRHGQPDVLEVSRVM